MGWSNSKIFTAFILASLENTTAYDMNTDAFKAALYNNTGTPSQTVSQANSAYNADQWVTANEVSDGTNWDAAGEPLTAVTSAFASNVYKFDAADTPQSGASTTLASVYGCLVYDDSISDFGICFNYFGGTNSVTAGSFTIVWNSSGIYTLTL